MYSTQISVDMKDKVFWKLSKNGCFCVCLYYTALRENDVSDFPWQEIWRVKAPLRVAFFVRMVFFGIDTHYRYLHETSYVHCETI